MDPIIAKLNEQAIRKVTQTSVGAPVVPSSEPSAFQRTFDNTLAEKLLDKMRESFDTEGANNMRVLSAEDIHITTANGEFEETNISSSEKFFDAFKDVNKDLLNLDAALETLTAPGVALSPRQLLAFQAGIANTTIMAEGFSRFTDTIARGIQTIVQTQVG